MPNGEETTRLLAEVEAFAGLDPRELQQIAQVAVPRSYERGEVIFREGDTGDTCYVVKTGSVSVMREHQDGRVIALAELRPGQIFGELAMFDHETRSATVETLEPTTTVALLSGDVQRILKAHPDIGVKMLAALASRLRRANERLLQQSFQTVAGRVASALLTQVIARQAEGAGDEDVLIKATQAEIAQLAGTSRESASRFLATLEREGVVSLGRGKTTVHEPARLRNYIH
jgi:CRP/FNR family cyclic AMP-dependent transcriptional regulator